MRMSHCIYDVLGHVLSVPTNERHTAASKYSPGRIPAMIYLPSSCHAADAISQGILARSGSQQPNEAPR